MPASTNRGEIVTGIPRYSNQMGDQLTVAINVISYMAGVWIAFKVFDLKKKGQVRDTKDDLLLWSLLACFALGVGTAFAYALKAWLV